MCACAHVCTLHGVTCFEEFGCRRCACVCVCVLFLCHFKWSGRSNFHTSCSAMFSYASLFSVKHANRSSTYVYTHTHTHACAHTYCFLGAQPHLNFWNIPHYLFCSLIAIRHTRYRFCIRPPACPVAHLLAYLQSTCYSSSYAKAAANMRWENQHYHRPSKVSLNELNVAVYWLLLREDGRTDRTVDKTVRCWIAATLTGQNIDYTAPVGGALDAKTAATLALSL